MEEGELLRVGLLRQRKRLLEGRVAEARVGLVLLAAVLRVVHQQVRIPAPPRELLEGAVLLLREHGNLVVGRENKAGRTLVDPVAEGWYRVHQQVWGDAQAAHLE